MLLETPSPPASNILDSYIPGLADTEPVPLRVLVIEDCDDDYLFELDALRDSGFLVSSLRVEREPDLRQALKSSEWQLVISDYVLPGLDGLRTLEIVRSIRQDLPLIIVSGIIDEAHAVRVMRAGAQDYVFKGNLARLGPAAHRELVEAERRRRAHAAEAELIEAEDRFRLAAVTSNDLIFEWDLHQRMDYFGDVDAMLGYAPGEFPHTVEAWAASLHPQDAERVLAARKLAVATGSPYDVEYRILGKNGTVYWWSVRGALTKATNRTPARFIGTAADITGRVRREEQLRQRNQELESFTYTVSHDLRSPLVTIQTFAGYLEQDLAAGDTATVATDLAYIRAGASKMALLIDHLLDISRVGRIVNPPLRLSMKSLVDDVLVSLGGRIRERNALMITGPEDVVLFAHRVRLAQVWQNLIENALKNMGDQTAPQVSIGVEQMNEDLVFFVRDNGVGIEEKFREKIFNLFEKLNPSTDGIGFGLALVKRIVELYEGRVWADSNGSERGTCFRFTLPGALREIEEPVEH